MPSHGHEKSAHVLVADDEPFVRNAFQLYLETNGFTCSAAENGQQTLEIIRQRKNAVDVLLLDLVMPGMYGIDVLKEVKRLDPSVEVVIATGCGTVHSAIEAMRYGAFDYITKPIVNFEEDLLRIVRSAFVARQRRESSAEAPVAEPVDLEKVGEYFDSLESTAGTLSSSEEFDRGFVQILERTFHADGALLLRRMTDGQLTPCRHWGSAVPPANLLDGAAGSLISTRFWKELLTHAPHWRSVCLPVPLLGLASNEAESERPIQALQITIPVAGAGQGVSSTYHLLLLRRREDDVTSPLAVPPLELFRLVIGESIRRTEATVAASHLEPSHFR